MFVDGIDEKYRDQNKLANGNVTDSHTIKSDIFVLQ